MMEIDEDDILRSVAAGGSMDYSIWPAMLPKIVERIEKITREDFPIPQLPPPVPMVISSSLPHHPAPSDSEDTENFLAPLPSSPTNPPSTSSSQETNKENNPVETRSNPPPASAPAPEPLPPGTLPPQITALVNEIASTLTSTFPKYPPHTIQRLAELILTPKHHYKSLPTYLHALDRVVHVTSGLNVYPLPPAVPDISTVSLLSNGVSDLTPSPWATPGSDEALGGALLTPIPWLQHGAQTQALSPQSQSQGSPSSSDRTNGSSDAEAELRTESTETIDGPNGMGSIETVTVTVNGVPSMGARGVGVTQGELLRQEQRAGVVPVSQLVPSHHSHHHPSQSPQHGPSRAPSATSVDGETPAAVGEEAVESREVVAAVTGADEDEKPHARGPEEIGPEDMGPQRESTTNPNYVGGPGVEMQGIDVEAAVGRKATESHSSPESKPADEGEEDKEDKMDGVESTRARSLTPNRHEPGL
ncbi:hypothetical protein BJ170DRAFT_407062 [Xylariales sp. AK1849]|nr:hypothetical protein BJ170DRAFT_407062 [Xylariales sp. AK1849]